jgi:hypothetical protein
VSDISDAGIKVILYGAPWPYHRINHDSAIQRDQSDTDRQLPNSIDLGKFAIRIELVQRLFKVIDHDEMPRRGSAGWEYQGRPAADIKPQRQRTSDQPTLIGVLR